MSFLHLFHSTRLKFLSALILVFPLFACSSGGEGSSSYNSSDLSWVAPSEREDGTGLALSDIASYRIYYGNATGEYGNLIDINDATATKAQLDELPSGIYFAVMTAIDTDGRESDYSSEIMIFI